MAINYYLADPTGNITILVDSEIPECERTTVAAELMSLEPLAEQVGFIGKGTDGVDITLSMAGGEFCGNASLSAAAAFCLKNGLKSGKVKVSVTGADFPVAVSILSYDNGEYTGTVNMPLPEDIKDMGLEYAGRNYCFPVVRFKGISHIICRETIEKNFAEKAARKWCGDLDADALGIIQIDLQKNSLLPLVYVKKADTLFWESSCASGTAATGAYLFELFGDSINMDFSEPAGKLSIAAGKDELKLTGKVRFLKIP